MKQIRRGIFETNSSSSHSISLADRDGLMDTLALDEKGNVVLNGGEFGWEEEQYSDAQSKASYMAIYAMDWAGKNKNKFIKILKDVIKKQTKCNDVIFNFSTDYDKDNWSYIDHQSVEDKDYDYLFEDEEKLRQFIFNPNSILTTDNDNH